MFWGCSLTPSSSILTKTFTGMNMWYIAAHHRHVSWSHLSTLLNSAWLSKLHLPRFAVKAVYFQPSFPDAMKVSAHRACTALWTLLRFLHPCALSLTQQQGSYRGLVFRWASAGRERASHFWRWSCCGLQWLLQNSQITNCLPLYVNISNVQ